jgi:nickel/cobalt exporter
MESSLFFVALQSSLVLGLIHGVNPCGHSWLVLAPFVVNGRDGRRTAVLTASFLAGTSLACLLLGMTLGSLSSFIPPRAATVMDMVLFTILAVLGLVLIINPELLHSHDHAHEHPHCGHVHGHEHPDRHHGGHGLRSRLAKAGAAGLFAIGFINMIVPCPTAAIMYTYAVNSGDWLKGTSVFLVYAIGTAVSVGGVIFCIHRAAAMARKLEKPWIESAIMRSAGLLTVVFATWGFIYGE